MSELRAIAKLCNFGTSLDITLRDRLVCGVNDSHSQLRLLSTPVLTLETTMKMVLGMESAAKNALTLQGGGEASAGSLLLNQVVVNNKCHLHMLWEAWSSPFKMEVQGCQVSPLR